MSNLDGNVWYQVTETRVDFNSSLQLNGPNQALRVFPNSKGNAAYLWQFLPVDNVKNRYSIRCKATYIDKQLSVCNYPNEPENETNQPCLADKDGTDIQKWDVIPWGDDQQTQKLQNVKFGAKYNLDVHPGSALFLNSETASATARPAQHWRFASYTNIDDVAYSTPASAVSPNVAMLVPS